MPDPQTPVTHPEPGIFVALAFLVLLGFVGAYDIVAIFSSGRYSTATTHIIAWAKEYPLVAFIAGFVSGHLWFPR